MKEFPQTYTDALIIGQVGVANAIGWYPTSYAVAKWLMVSVPTATRHIKRLEERGLVTYQKDSRHARLAKTVDVTQDGVEFLQARKVQYAAYLLFLFKKHASSMGLVVHDA